MNIFFIFKQSALVLFLLSNFLFVFTFLFFHRLPSFSILVVLNLIIVLSFFLLFFCFVICYRLLYRTKNIFFNFFWILHFLFSSLFLIFHHHAWFFFLITKVYFSPSFCSPLPIFFFCPSYPPLLYHSFLLSHLSSN